MTGDPMADVARASWWNRTFRPGMADGAETFENWLDRTISLLLIASLAFSLPGAVAAVFAASRQSQPTRILLLGGAYALVLATAMLPRRIPFWVRAGILLAIPLTLGVVSVWSQGLAGSGRILLIAFPLAATILFGIRGGAFAFLISLVVYGTVAWAAVRGGSFSSAITPNPADIAAWTSSGGALVLLGGLLVAGLGYVRERLAASMRQGQTLFQSTERERVDLEVRLAEGTRGLMRQALQLQTTAEIARLASQKMDPQQLLERAVELIRQQFGFYHASVFLIDPTGTWAELAASNGEVGRSLQQRNYRLAIGSASLIGWATANRLTRLALDVEQDPFYFRNPLLPETRAELAVPLQVGERLLGALDVQSVEAQGFQPDDVRAIEAIAGELAVAMDSAKELQDVRVRLEEAEGLVRGRVRASWDRLARKEVPEVIRIAPGGEEELGVATSLGSMAAAEQFGRRVVTEDGREAAFPIVVRGEVVASLGARRGPDEEAWSEDDLNLIEAIAGQAALAVENARQNAEEHRRLGELEVLNRVSQAVSQMLRLDSLLKVVHVQINQLLGSVNLTYAFYDSATGQLSQPYISQTGDVKSLPPRPLGDDLVSYVVRSQTPLLLGSDLPARAAGIGVRLDAAAPRSWLGVPMLVGEDVVGVIAVEDLQLPERFTDDDAALLSTIASQVAAAFQNARLLEQVQRTARRERLIHEIATKVRRAPDFRTILETTTRELGRALNAARASVQLGPGNGGSSDGKANPEEES